MTIRAPRLRVDILPTTILPSWPLSRASVFMPNSGSSLFYSSGVLYENASTHGARTAHQSFRSGNLISTRTSYLRYSTIIGEVAKLISEV